MHISLRSHLIVGTAAVVGASAIAMTPVLSAEASLPTIATPSMAKVALVGLDNPLTELLATAAMVNNDIFNGADTYADYAWEPYQGLIPEFIYDALPIISQLGYNGASYIGGSFAALNNSATIVSEAVWNLPGAVITAVGQAVSGDTSGALTTLSNATLVPLQEAGTQALTAGYAVLTSVISNIGSVIVTVPGIAQGLATSVVGSLQAVAGAVVNIATQTGGALSTLDLQTAWNVVVDGLLGPVGADGTVASSLPGTIEAVTIGPGVGPLGNPNGYAVPSLRMWVEQSNLRIANAIGANFPVSAASVAPPAASKRARSAAAVRSGSAVTAPAVGAAPSSAKVAAGARADKPAPHRVSRAAARAGSDS